MSVKHEQLSLIPPSFEVPLPPLQPAVFFPMLRQLPVPTLDLFDLDEKFASEKLRLAQLTNKCGDDDLEYFVREAGEVLGVSQTIRDDNKDKKGEEEEKVSGKQILHYILKKLVQYKSWEQNEEGANVFNQTDDSMNNSNFHNSNADLNNSMNFQNNNNNGGRC